MCTGHLFPRLWESRWTRGKSSTLLEVIIMDDEGPRPPCDTAGVDTASKDQPFSLAAQGTQRLLKLRVHSAHLWKGSGTKSSTYLYKSPLSLTGREDDGKCCLQERLFESRFCAVQRLAGVAFPACLCCLLPRTAEPEPGTPLPGVVSRTEPQVP